MSRRHAGARGLDPILAAKGRIPSLPCPHVPRPRVLTTLGDALREQRLVVLTAGALTGKTTALAELAHALAIEHVSWYSVDEVDSSARMLLEGLARATGATVPAMADELGLLAAVVGALDRGPAHAVLILDDVHRAPEEAGMVVDRLLRYLPPHAHLLLSGWAGRFPLPVPYYWLEERGQAVHLDATLLRLDEEERERFRALTGRPGGAWPVDYRPGGQTAVVERLRRGVLPLLEPEQRVIVDLLALLPGATVAVLGAACALPKEEIIRRVTALHEETILLERIDLPYARLSETAQQAALAQLDEPARHALRFTAATALEPHDPAQAAYLFALAGHLDRATSAAQRVSWWEWRERYTLAQMIEALLPAALLRQAGALALLGAHRRLLEQGAGAAHALLRSLRPTEPIEQIERWRLLARCCTARGRSESLVRCVSVLEALVRQQHRAIPLQVYAYGLLVLGIAQGCAGAYRQAVDILRSCLDVLILDGGSDTSVAAIHLSACQALAIAQRRLGHLAEAERLFAEAEALARTAGTPYIELELSNNRAVLLQQRGAHAESVEVLRAALASPWSAERGLRPLLQASLADALSALGDRAGAAQALHAALADLQVRDAYGLLGHVRAVRALLLAEGGQAIAAADEIAAGASPDHPATLLARALLLDPCGPDARVALQAALKAVAEDLPLRAQMRAHLARICALQGDRQRARAYADAVTHDSAYPLTPREAAILGPHTRRVRQPRMPTPAALQASVAVSIRFFGSPTLTIAGRVVGTPWWTRSKGRELLWYALVHGREGFTREEAYADLFPEMNAEAAARAFRNTLYELRKLLRTYGVADALRLVNGRLRLLPEELGTPWEADTQTLQAWLACLRQGESAALGDVSVLLRGAYLSDLYGDWIGPFRYYWEREAVHALDLAATQYERAGRAAEAVTCLQRAVDFCPDDAALLRRVLLLYHAVGDVAGLRATYLGVSRDTPQNRN